MAGLEITPIARSQDFSIIRQNEENRPQTEQLSIAQETQKENDAKSTEVVHADESRWNDKRQDASEKGANEYTGDGGKRRRQRKEDEDRVIIKGQSSGFDLKI